MPTILCNHRPRPHEEMMPIPPELVREQPLKPRTVAEYRTPLEGRSPSESDIFRDATFPPRTVRGNSSALDTANPYRASSGR